jgi:hypothetical protein
VIPESVERHLLEQFGPPSRAAHFRRSGRSIDVYKWAADATNEGVALYATAGASAYSMTGMPPDHRLEFFVGLNPEQDDIASHLAALALYAFEEHTSIAHGHTVPAGRPLWSGTEMTSFLVLTPISDIIKPFKIENGIHVEFLQAIPVFPSEVAFKASHNAEQLVARWQQARVPFWNPERFAEPASPIDGRA